VIQKIANGQSLFLGKREAGELSPFRRGRGAMRFNC